MRTAGRLLSAGKEGQKQQVRRGWQRGEGFAGLVPGPGLCPRCHGVDVKACLDAGNRDPKSRDQADLG